MLPLGYPHTIKVRSGTENGIVHSPLDLTSDGNLPPSGLRVEWMGKPKYQGHHSKPVQPTYQYNSCCVDGTDRQAKNESFGSPGRQYRACFKCSAKSAPTTKSKSYVGTLILQPRPWKPFRVLALYFWATYVWLPVSAAPVRPRGEIGIQAVASSQKTANRGNITATGALTIMAACFVCTSLVVGARYWRRTWKFLGPFMGGSGVAFAILKDGVTAESEYLSMIALAVWSIATTAYIWTAKDLIPASRYPLYILGFALTTGTCTYLFADRLQERPLIVVPPCAAACAFMCKWFFELRCLFRDTAEDRPLEVRVENSLAPDASMLGRTTVQPQAYLITPGPLMETDSRPQ